MLSITDAAADAIKSMTADAGLPEGGGLRITVADPAEGLELSVAERAEPDDTVLTGEGLTLFLGPAAAEVLADKVLDVRPVTNAAGEEEVRFAIAPQAQPDDPAVGATN